MVYKKGPLDLVTHEQRRNCVFFVKVKRIAECSRLNWYLAKSIDFHGQPYKMS